MYSLKYLITRLITEPPLQDLPPPARPRKESETESDTNKNTSMTNKQVPLREALAVLDKHKPPPGKDAVIPSGDYDCMYRNIETALHNQEQTKETNPEKSPVGSNEEKKKPTVQMLNNFDTTAGVKFKQTLRQKLEDRVNVKDLTNVEESDPKNVLIMIGEYLSTQETVDKLLKYVKEDMYGRLIVIVVHVKREGKLPRTDTRAQLNSNEYNQVGKILDMGYLPNEGIYTCSKNSTALKEIYEFLESNASIQEGFKHKLHSIEQAASGPGVNRNVIQKGTSQNAYLLMDCKTTHLVRKFAEKFIAWIRKQGVVLLEIKSVDVKKLETDLPIYVVCNNNSRIETDLISCLQDIPGKVYRRIVLVVLHVCRNESRHTTYTRQYLQTSSSDKKYEDIRKIVDIAYSKDDDIYSCKMNEEAFNVLKDFHA